jgi:hypothetical protein
MIWLTLWLENMLEIFAYFKYPAVVFRIELRYNKDEKYFRKIIEKILRKKSRKNISDEIGLGPFRYPMLTYFKHDDKTYEFKEDGYGKVQNHGERYCRV